MRNSSRFRRDMLAEIPLWMRIAILAVVASAVSLMVYGDGALYWAVRTVLWVSMIYFAWNQRGKIEAAQSYSPLSRAWAGLLGGTAAASVAWGATLAIGVLIANNQIGQLVVAFLLASVAVALISWPEVELRVHNYYTKRSTTRRV